MITITTPGTTRTTITSNIGNLKCARTTLTGAIAIAAQGGRSARGPWRARSMSAMLVLVAITAAALLGSYARATQSESGAADANTSAVATTPATSTTPAPATARTTNSADLFARLNPGLVGGLAGAGIGVLGGLIGCVGGLCAPRGKAKGFVLSLFGVQIIVGLALMALGIASMMSDAPWMVSYSFLLPGGLSFFLGVGLLPVVLARYRQAELRRVEAETFRAG